jgi:hypothetical protein
VSRVVGLATIGISSLGTGIWTFVVALLATLAGGIVMRKSERVQLFLFVGLVTAVVLGVGSSIVVDRYHQYRLDHGTVKLAIQLLVRTDSSHAYGPRVTAAPGQRVEFAMPVQNLGTGIARKVSLGVNLAPYQTPVCGSPRLSDSNTAKSGETFNSATPGGCLGSGFFTTTQEVDDLGPGPAGGATLYFSVTISPCVPPGQHPLQSVGTARSGKGNQYYNVALIDVDVAAGTSAAGCPAGVP